MTERDAWSYLEGLWAKAIHYLNLGYHAVILDEDYCLGLCPCIHDLKALGWISAETRGRMLEKIGDDWRPGTSLFRWPRDAAGAIARSRFCKTQAEKL